MSKICSKLRFLEIIKVYLERDWIVPPSLKESWVPTHANAEYWPGHFNSQTLQLLRVLVLKFVSIRAM